MSDSENTQVLNINTWRSDLQKPLQHITKNDILVAQTFNIPCTIDEFWKKIAERPNRGTKEEYIKDHAEVTICSCPFLHNAMRGSRLWKSWLQHLPDFPALLDLGAPQIYGKESTGVRDFILNIGNSLVVYRDSKIDPIVGAAYVQLSSFFTDSDCKGRIICLTAYANNIDAIREMARSYLCESDEPRPCVVILLIFRIDTEQKKEDEAADTRESNYVGMQVSFEVYRCDASNGGVVRLWETGYAWPHEKAEDPGNTQRIPIMLEEIFGTSEVMTYAIYRKKKSKNCGEGIDRLLWDVPNALLEELYHLISEGAKTYLPVSLLTRAIDDAFIVQRSMKRRARSSDAPKKSVVLEEEKERLNRNDQKLMAIPNHQSP